MSTLVPNGVKGATDDFTTVVEWLLMQPEANWGIATGQGSGLVVLDIDPRHGGEESLLALTAQYGRLPETLEVLTGGGGRHLYFRYPDGVDVRNSAGALGPGLDIRGEGGYVVAPPSIHISGGIYQWDDMSDPENDEPVDLPDWLLELISVPPKAPSNGRQVPNGATVPQGQRNSWLISEAGKMRRAGMDEAGIAAALKTLNSTHCDPPLQDTEVERIAHSVCRYVPGYALTDAGNAEFFADAYGGQVCFRYDTRRWMIWKSPIWVVDADGEVERMALQSVRERQAQALSIQDADQRKKTLTFLLNSENGYRLRSMLEIAKSRPTVAKSGQEFDKSPMLLAVRNGIIDLKTGDFREGSPDDYLTQCAGTEYDPQATAPRWEQFLSEIFLGDAELIAFVQRLVGYTLTGDTSEQVFVFCHGAKGQNGKSTLFRVLQALLGDYAKATSFHTFTRRNENSGHSESLMALEGARLITASENETAQALNESVIKALTGQDPITGSRKHEHERTFIPEFKLWLAANKLPRVNDVTPAFWRRVILLPFRARFEGDRADKHLFEKLVRESAGILNWCLTGCLAWQRDGLKPPRQCTDAAEAWRADNDPLAEFLATCKTGAHLEVKVGELFKAYELFCSLNNNYQAVKSIQAFSRLVRDHGFDKIKRMDGSYFIGLSI
jgi:putative DNA primase/helicase